MAETKGLYIDDDPGDLERGVAWELEPAFSEAFEPAQMELDTKGFDHGESILRDNPNGYDLVFVDIMDGEKERGLTIISKLARDSSSVVIAITHYSGPLEKARTQGAHGGIYKNRVSEPGYIAERLKEAYAAAKKTPPVTLPTEVAWDRRNFQLEATVQSVGEESLHYLIAKFCRKPPAKVRLGFLRSGMSGALVLHCHCEIDGAPNEGFLLKASRDQRAAEVEFEAWQEIPQGLRSLFPPPPKSLVEVDGWHALAIDYRDGVTFTDWLTKEGPSGEGVANALERLFLQGGLSTHYAGSIETFDQKSPMDVMLEDPLQIGRRARIQAAKDDLLPLAERYVGGGEEISAAVERLLHDGQLVERGVETLPLGSSTAISHGDLHGRNVVVGEPQPAILIDPANMVALHPAADWSRLTVDVLLTGFAVREDSHDWGALEEWRQAVGGFVAGETLPERLLPPGSTAAADWLRSHAEAVFAPLGEQAPAEWELRLALAVELLRAIPRAEILPAPVRVLALLASVDALGAAAAAAPPKEGA